MKQAELTTCFYLLMQIASSLHVLFILIFSIYLFKAVSTKAGGNNDLYLLMKITSCDTWFSF